MIMKLWPRYDGKNAVLGMFLREWRGEYARIDLQVTEEKCWLSWISDYSSAPSYNRRSTLKRVEKKKKKAYRKGEVLFLWCFSFLMARKASRILLALLVLSDGEILPEQCMTRKIKKDKMYVHLAVPKVSSQSGLETTAQIYKLLSIF